MNVHMTRLTKSNKVTQVIINMLGGVNVFKVFMVNNKASCFKTHLTCVPISFQHYLSKSAESFLIFFFFVVGVFIINPLRFLFIDLVEFLAAVGVFVSMFYVSFYHFIFKSRSIVVVPSNVASVTPLTTLYWSIMTLNAQIHNYILGYLDTNYNNIGY